MHKDPSPLFLPVPALGRGHFVPLPPPSTPLFVFDGQLAAPAATTADHLLFERRLELVRVQGSSPRGQPFALDGQLEPFFDQVRPSVLD